VKIALIFTIMDLTSTGGREMKGRAVSLGLIVAVSCLPSTPLWAKGEKAAEPVTMQRQSVTEELMVMLKETMGILSNLDHAPTVEEKRHLAEMMSRLDTMLKRQQSMMRDMQDQLDAIRQQQDEYFQRQQTLERQQNLQQR
jgi:uncharacterized membrane protein YfbV (UPF0208 family)